MSGWQSRVKDLLYENETVKEVVDVEDSRVVVTSHRVMAFTPNMDGENFRQVERPNVTGVGMGSLGKTDLAGRSVRYGIYGILLIVVGLLIDFENYIGGVSFDAEAAQDTGAGGIVSMAQGMMNFMAQLDELMQVVGALVLLVAVVLFAVYWLLRTPTLVIEVAGDEEDIQVPRPEEADLTATTLEQAIIPDDVAEESEGRLESVVPDEFL